MNRKEIKKEWQIVLLGSVDMDESQAGQFKKLLSETVDWSQIVFQLITHRSLNIFYYNLKKLDLFHLLEKEIQRLMKSQWHVFGERNRFYLDELKKIVTEFKKRDLVAPILKGNLLASIVYPVLETRIFNDLDLLIKLDDVNKISEILEDLGYKQGHFDEKEGKVVEATRKEKMLQQIASHELQEFQKLSRNSFAPLIQVDVNHDILWKGNCPYKVDSRDLISRALPVDLDGAPAYMLDYIDNIIQLSCHLFKEATLMMWVTDLRDLKIYKFADLYSYIKKFFNEIQWELLLERVKGYKIEKIIYYNFYYITLMFGDIVPQEIMHALEPADLAYLDEYGIENQKPAKWEYDFFTRLFDSSRILAVDPDKTRNIERFIEAKISVDGKMEHRTVKNEEKL